MLQLVIIAIVVVAALLLCAWVWFGPRRCPFCERLVFRRADFTKGSRQVKFRCRECGARF
jgi:hypothetical protein